MRDQQGVIVKTYKGSQDEATRLFQEDAATLAERGYYPTSQSYAPGSYGCGSFVLALLLCFIFVGILILIYMLLVKPSGVLSVTYEFRGNFTSKSQDEKTCPKCAEQIKAAARVCRFCGHEFDPEALIAAEEATRKEARQKTAAALAIQKQTLSYRLGRWIGQRRAEFRARRPR